MQNDTVESSANESREEMFTYIERDARRYDKAFVEEAEAKHI